MAVQVQNQLQQSVSVWLRLTETKLGDVGTHACVIAPGYAVALAFPSPVGSRAPLELVHAGGTETRYAELVYRHEPTDICLIRFDAAESDRRFEGLKILANEVPPAGAEWECYAFDRESNDFFSFKGEVRGSVPVAGVEQIRLATPLAALRPAEFRGAPIVDEHGVIGIVASADEARGELLAIPAYTIRSIMQEHLRQLADANQDEETGTYDVNPGASFGTRSAPRKSPARAGKKSPDEETPVPFDETVFWGRLSTSSRRALAHADGMRRGMDQPTVHMEHLILALYQKDNGPTQRELQRAGIDGATLRGRLARILEMEMPGEYVVPELDALPPLSEHTRKALMAAQTVADDFDSLEVQSRHLFYGVLTVTECGAVRWMLEEFGVDLNRIDITAQPVRGMPAGRARAQVIPDNPDGIDLLDLQGEVDAICSVIAARDTDPPLSIGLFGDWGTGKSFFMTRMEKTVEELKTIARNNPTSAFYPNIVQLRFNAWHYMDTDLWASLAAEIFEGLARQLDQDSGLLDGQENPTIARARLLAATSHLRALQDDAEQRKVKADAELRASAERLISLAQDEREIEAKLTPQELLKTAYRFVAAQPVTAKSLDDAAQKLGIPKARALASDTRATLLDLRTLWDGVRLLMRSGQARLWILLSLTVVFLVVFLGMLVQFTDRIAPILTSFAALLATAIPFVRKLIPPAREALSIVKNARQQNEALIQEETERRESELRQAHQAIQQRVSAEETAIARVTTEMAQLERQLERLRSDTQMREYVRSRHQSTDYTKHFGVIARARADFEQLTELLDRTRKEKASNEKQADGKVRPPSIDRIILYIDDLDRCPEAKVVDVLQAVHLLMALPIFIVVVAVDSRWLLHSLRQQATVFRTSDVSIDGMDDEERFHWESTPFNYLEKIFQIPFNLRPLDEAGFVRLIDELTRPKSTDRRDHPTRGQEDRVAERKVAEGTVPEKTVAERTDTADSALQPVRLANAALRIDQPLASPSPSPLPSPSERTRAIDPNPPYLDLTQGERAFMQQMHRLIPTPRAAKRYVNVYRLLRASLPDKLRVVLEDEKTERSHFVLLMLAVLTGFPQEGALILRELVERKPTGAWWDFVDTLADEVIDAPPDSNNAQRAQRWRELRDRLASVRGQLLSDLAEDAPCSAFHEWARLVARYSFESGRVLKATPEQAREPVEQSSNQ